MDKIIIINGPNLNLLGVREPAIYGESSFESYFDTLQAAFPEVRLSFFQSNHEGALIDKLHECGFDHSGIVLNAGALTHTSIGIADAIAGISTPVVEVHLSNVFARESYRHQSFMAGNCVGVISGFGLNSYRLAVAALLAR